MSTHSLSGARQRRQQALPEFCVIVVAAGEPSDVCFFFFTESSCRKRRISGYITCKSHGFSGIAADSELACIFTVYRLNVFFLVMALRESVKQRE
jgi:hypothetical protein